MLKTYARSLDLLPGTRKKLTRKFGWFILECNHDDQFLAFRVGKLVVYFAALDKSQVGINFYLKF